MEMTSHKTYRIRVVLEYHESKPNIFPEYIWRITFTCPYCKGRAQAQFSEELARLFVQTISVIPYSCGCQAWTGFNVFELPETFSNDAPFTIETFPPQESP